MNSLRFSGSDWLRDVLGGDRRAADDEHVDAGVDDGLDVLLGALRRERAGDGDPGGAHLLEPLGDQLGLDRLGVDLLHPAGGLGAREPGDLLQQAGRVVVPRPEALEVEHAEAAHLAERDRGRRRHHRVHRRGQHRDVEAVGVDLPGGADLLGVARAPRGHDRDVVEGVRAATALGTADLDLGHARAAYRRGLRSRGRGRWPGCGRRSRAAPRARPRPSATSSRRSAPPDPTTVGTDRQTSLMPW